MTAPGGATAVPVPRLWTRDFLLLWQGQLVSAAGDAVYAIALGFWILQETGSTAMMGTLMSVSTLPRVLVSPLAGVVVDRGDRKWLLVWMDLLRGIAVLGVGAAALTRRHRRQQLGGRLPLRAVRRAPDVPDQRTQRLRGLLLDGGFRAYLATDPSPDAERTTP